MVDPSLIQQGRWILGLDKLPAALGRGTGQPRAGNGMYWVRRREAGGLSAPVALPLAAGLCMVVYEGAPVEVGYDKKLNQVIYPSGATELNAAGVNAYITNALDRTVQAAIKPDDIPMFLCFRHLDTTNKPLTVVVLVPPVILNDDVVLPTVLETDLGSFVPSAGLHCWAVVFWKQDNTLEAFASTPINLSDPLTNVDLQEALALGSTGSLPVRAWRLADDQAILSNDPTQNLDLRQFANLPGTGGGGSGTVTSVGLSMPTEFSVAGSPITGAGTLAVSKANQNANEVYAGPAAGGAAAPVFRALVNADIPSTLTGETLVSPVIDTGVSGSAIDTDPTFAANSDTLLPSQKAVKSYVDAVATGLSPKQSVVVATAAALPSNTYSNGSSGVGATLTATANGTLTVDGVSIALNDRVLVKDEATGANNGIYKCTQTGSGGTPYILTRSEDANISAEVVGAFVFVEGGTVNASAGFVCANTGTITIGTTAITFTQFSGAGEISVSTGLTKTGNTLGIDTAVVATLTGAQTLANKILSQLQLLIGGFKGIFTHANTADRTYTLPNYDGTLATLAGTESLSNKTIVSSLFADYWRQPVRAVATANVSTSSAPSSIDSVTLSSGDRVLLTQQTTASQNGIWVFNGASSAMSRPTDYAAASTTWAFKDVMVYVKEGTNFLGSVWRIITTGTITVDTTNHNWTITDATFLSWGLYYLGFIGRVTTLLSGNRTWSIPDASGNIVVDSATQTLTNKSISGSQINSGTINEARLPHKVAILQYVVAQNTNGGTPTANAWTPRPLNTITSDPNSIISGAISSNQFTPVAGTYQLRAYCSIFATTGNYRHRLRNATAGSTPTGGVSPNGRLGNGGAAAGEIGILEVPTFTANGTDAFEIDYYVSQATTNTGLGVAMNVSGESEIYMTIVLEKVG